MIRFATRLPPSHNVTALDNGLIRKTEWYARQSQFEFIVALLEHVTKHPEPLIVPVYEYRILESGPRDFTVSYDMMHCGILEKEERDFVDSVGEAWDLFHEKVFEKLDAGACGPYQDELRSGCQKLPELAKFLRQVVDEGRYMDLHSGNVMRNQYADYVLIDLEGFVRTPLNAPYNNWIAR